MYKRRSEGKRVNTYTVQAVYSHARQADQRLRPAVAVCKLNNYLACMETTSSLIIGDSLATILPVRQYVWLLAKL